MNYATLVSSQRAYFNSNITKSIDFRIKQLQKLQELINTHRDDFNKAIYSDFKKSEYEYFITEINIVQHEIKQSIKNIRKWSKYKRVGTNLLNLPAKSYIVPEPLGVCFILGAWNYPFQLSLSPLVAALAAGNTVVLKPSEQASETSKVVARIINSNFNADYLAVVEGGVAETSLLLEQKFDKIFFTGSTAVGQIVYKAAAEHLTPVTLELGGKSPVLVVDNTHIKETARRIVWAKFINAGQTCIAPDYILVEKSLEEELLKELKAHIERFDYAVENNNYVQIINDKHYERLVSLVEVEKIYSGGTRLPEERYIAPTLLHSVNWTDKVMQEEIFGPLLPVLTFTHLDEVINEIKMRPMPLSLYLYTDSKKIKTKIIQELSFGGGAINDSLMHISNMKLPFGGVGSSGMGNYHGEAGFKCFSHEKSILEKSFRFEPLIKYPPYTQRKMNLLKKLFKLE